MSTQDNDKTPDSTPTVQAAAQSSTAAAEAPPTILDLDLSDSRLPKMAALPFRHAFSVSVFVEEPSETPPYEPTRREYTGVFVCKRMTLAEMNQVEVRRQTMTAGVQVPPAVELAADRLAYLEGCLLVAPAWWQPSAMYSMKLINIVYEKVIALHDTFRVRVLGT